MTNEEKRMVMQFMGQTYGETKKQDEMLIASSGNLRPKSEEIKQVFTQMASQPTVSNYTPQQPAPQQPVPEQVTAPVPEQASVDYGQAVKELAQIDQVATQPVASEQVQDPNQLTFDLKERSVLDELLEASKKTNLLLKDIKLLLERKDGKPAKKKTTSKKPG